MVLQQFAREKAVRDGREITHRFVLRKSSVISLVWPWTKFIFRVILNCIPS